LGLSQPGRRKVEEGVASLQTDAVKPVSPAARAFGRRSENERKIIYKTSGIPKRFHNTMTMPSTKRDSSKCCGRARVCEGAPAKARKGLKGAIHNGGAGCRKAVLQP
jgi:hypothetical protein